MVSDFSWFCMGGVKEQLADFLLSKYSALGQSYLMRIFGTLAKVKSQQAMGGGVRQKRQPKFPFFDFDAIKDLS